MRGISVKNFISFAVLLVFVVLQPFGQQLAANADADTWPQFRGNPSLTGVASLSPPSSLQVV